MKKSVLTYLLLSVISGTVYAQQTGIGTLNPQGPLHIDGAKDNGTGVPTPTQAINDVIVTNSGFIGVGTLNPVVKVDLRSANVQNAFGLGQTTMTAATAKAGAVRYDEVNVPVGAKIEVSDGIVWNKLYVSPQKAVVVARKISAQSIGNSATILTNWQEKRDMSSSFDEVSGQFTAPRTATYTFLLTFNFNAVNINDGTRVESQFYRTSGTTAVLASVYKTFGQSMTGTPDDAFSIKQTQAGGSSTVTLTLNQGDVVVTRLLHNLINGNIGLRRTSSTDPTHSDAGFNNLTIIEH